MSEPRPEEAIPTRKADHIRFAASAEAEPKSGAKWADITLLPRALPTADLDQVELYAEFLGRGLKAPLVISSMTGGFEAAREINAILAAAAERHGIAMGVGSQRAALRNPDLAATFSVVSESVKKTMLIANIGAPQLVPQESGPAVSGDDIDRLARMIQADALAVHFNYLQEAVQPEGDRRAHGLREAIATALANLELPAIAKETGAGLSETAALEMRGLGFKALDVGGQGGTSFALIEGLRAQASGDARGSHLGSVFGDWGIPTPVSVVMARAADLPIIATGGIRSGLDAAKAIALGATLVGVARPLLLAALQGSDAVDHWLYEFLEELRLAIFLTGGKSPRDLREARYVVLGDTRAWLTQLGH